MALHVPLCELDACTGVELRDEHIHRVLGPLRHLLSEASVVLVVHLRLCLEQVERGGRRCGVEGFVNVSESSGGEFRAHLLLQRGEFASQRRHGGGSDERVLVGMRGRLDSLGVRGVVRGDRSSGVFAGRNSSSSKKTTETVEGEEGAEEGSKKRAREDEDDENAPRKKTLKDKKREKKLAAAAGCAAGAGVAEAGP